MSHIKFEYFKNNFPRNTEREKKPAKENEKIYSNKTLQKFFKIIDKR
jgi:hypothetical protein